MIQLPIRPPERADRSPTLSTQSNHKLSLILALCRPSPILELYQRMLVSLAQTTQSLRFRSLGRAAGWLGGRSGGRSDGRARSGDRSVGRTKEAAEGPKQNQKLHSALSAGAADAKASQSFPKALIKAFRANARLDRCYLPLWAADAKAS